MKPRYMYLDQNHWIYLAKDYWGRPHKPIHKGISQKLLGMVASDRVRLPLSTIHFIEHLRAENPERRKRLAQVFDEFSQGWHMASWATVLPFEINRAIAISFGKSPTVPHPEMFGKGFLFGLASKERELLIKDRTEQEWDSLQSLAALPGALLHLLTFPNEAGRQRQNASVAEMSGTYALAAENLRSKRKPHSTEMHRRAQYAGYTLHHQELVVSALATMGLSLDEFLNLGLENLKKVWSSVPSLDVDCELTLYRDRQWNRSVEPNDVRDIGYLSLAVPYCDVVITERFWARAIEEVGLAKKYGTVVCADLTEVVE